MMYMNLPTIQGVHRNKPILILLVILKSSNCRLLLLICYRLGKQLQRRGEKYNYRLASSMQKKTKILCLFYITAVVKLCTMYNSFKGTTQSKNYTFLVLSVDTNDYIFKMVWNVLTTTVL